MRYKSLVFLSLIVSTISYGQATIKEIKGVDPMYKNNKYKFPIIIVPNNKIVSNKINDLLLLDVLDINRKQVKKSIFENVWLTKEIPLPRLNDLSYTMIVNNKKFLSLSISGEGCGAYCEYFTFYYSFNFKTGDIVKPDSLFNKAGRNIFLDSLNSKKKQILKSKVKEIQDTLSSQSVREGKEEREYFEEMLSLYQDCLEKDDVTDFDYLRFYITKSRLFVSLDRCSAHYNRNLDEIGDFELIFKFKDWAKYLTPYAHSLINE